MTTLIMKHPFNKIKALYAAIPKKWSLWLLCVCAVSCGPTGSERKEVYEELSGKSGQQLTPNDGGSNQEKQDGRGGQGGGIKKESGEQQQSDFDDDPKDCPYKKKLEALRRKTREEEEQRKKKESQKKKLEDPGALTLKAQSEQLDKDFQEKYGEKAMEEKKRQIERETEEDQRKLVLGREQQKQKLEQKHTENQRKLKEKKKELERQDAENERKFEQMYTEQKTKDAKYRKELDKISQTLNVSSKALDQGINTIKLSSEMSPEEKKKQAEREKKEEQETEEFIRKHMEEQRLKDKEIRKKVLAQQRNEQQKQIPGCKEQALKKIEESIKERHKLLKAILGKIPKLKDELIKLESEYEKESCTTDNFNESLKAYIAKQCKLQKQIDMESKIQEALNLLSSERQKLEEAVERLLKPENFQSKASFEASLKANLLKVTNRIDSILYSFHNPY